MPFPESKRVVFRENPLKGVICQLRFPTILKIGVEPPARFQDKIRSSYPLYSREDTFQNLPKEIANILEQLRIPLPFQTQAPTHKFATEDEFRFISLNPEFIAVTENRYQRWEHFRAEIERAKMTVEEEYNPTFYSRIGLRYQDIIDREQLGLNEPWDALVNRSLISVLGASDLRDEVREIQSEALIVVPGVKGGFVRLRHGLRKLPTYDRQVYHIDSDFYTSERSGTNDVLKILDEFRRVAGNLFRWAASPRLQQALKPAEID